MLTVNDLDDYQKKAIRFCNSIPRSYLSMEMGLGKTVCSLTIGRLWMRDGVKAILYVAPINICLTVVEQESKLWRHLKNLRFVFLNGKNKDELLLQPADIYLINPEGIKWLHQTLYRRLKRKDPSFPFNGLIVDEGTKFKGRGVTWRKLKGMYPIFNRVIVMSGRPAPNSLMELWPQVFLLDRGLRLGKTFTSFRKQHFYPDYRGFKWEIKDGHDSVIHEKIRDITYTVDPELAKLPQIKTKELCCILPATMLKQYRAFQKKKILELRDGGKLKVKNSMSLSIKLRQFCQGLIYDANSILSIHEIKFRALKELVESLSGKPLMVVYNFNHERDFLLSKLEGSEFIGGGVEKEDRIDIIERWNKGEIPVLIVHPRAVSHGLNMQFGGNRIAFYSPTWSGDEYVQLIARLRRKGQSSGIVIVFHITLKSTIDEVMYRSVSKKTSVHTELINSLLGWGNGS